MTRNEIVTELTRAGATLVGFEYNTDDLVSEAYHKWLGMHSPKYAIVIIDREIPKGAERVIIEVPESFELE